MKDNGYTCWSHQGDKALCSCSHKTAGHAHVAGWAHLHQLPVRLKHYHISTSFSRGGRETTSFISFFRSRSLLYVCLCVQSSPASCGTPQAEELDVHIHTVGWHEGFAQSVSLKLLPGQTPFTSCNGHSLNSSLMCPPLVGWVM